MTLALQVDLGRHRVFAVWECFVERVQSRQHRE
jgi:hypothetical protein